MFVLAMLLRAMILSQHVMIMRLFLINILMSVFTQISVNSFYLIFLIYFFKEIKQLYTTNRVNGEIFKKITSKNERDDNYEKNIW